MSEQTKLEDQYYGSNYQLKYESRPASNPDFQPTTGEWTAQTVFDLLGSDYGDDGWKRERNVAAAHNAALTAERCNRNLYVRHVEHLQKQIAALEKVVKKSQEKGDQ